MRSTLPAVTLSIVGAATILPAGPIAADPPDETPPLIHREQQDDPPGVWTPGRDASARQPIGGGAGSSVQVNVDSQGANIPGDAANEPSIAVDPTAPNRMAIGWRQFDTIQSNFRQAGWGYSNDGGRTWTFPGVINPGLFRSDPVLDYDTDGNLYYLSLKGDFSCDLFISDDGGMSWDGGSPAFGGDKEWFGIDRTGGIGHGNIYHTWSPFFTDFNGNFTRSTDGGQTFANLVFLPIDLFWGTVSVGPDGTLYLSGVDLSFGGRMIRSSNAQNPAQNPVFDQVSVVDVGGVLVQGDNPNPGGLMGQMWIATDHSGGATHGNVYMLGSVNPPGGDPLDVMFTRSEDNGVTWSNPVRVNDDPRGEWQWFGTMSVAPNGRIDAIWNDTRTSGLDNISELFYAFSTDGGVTWSANQQLSPSYNSHIGWPQQDKIGDYYDMISDDVGAHVAWAATFNGEQDVYYLRINDYDCNANGIADTDDIVSETSADCNENDIPDECEIAAGTETDDNGNGVIDSCEDCPWDLTGDGQVATADLLDLLSAWGTNPGGPPDFDGSGAVGTADLLKLLSNWGMCP